MAFRQLALALGTFAFLFVAACGGTSPGKLDTDSAAMPWVAPDEEELVGDDYENDEPDQEFPVPDLPLDDDDDGDAAGGDTPDTTAASDPADATKAADPKAPKAPKKKAP